MRLQILIYLLFTLSACGQTEKNPQQTSTMSEIDTLQKHTENMSDYSPTFDKAHPNAKRLMNEAFYFNPIDEYGPFGNDDGADTYAGFQEWRRTNKTKNSKEFLVEQISRWGYPTVDYNETNFEKLKPYLKQSEIGSRLLTGTDASIIAIAFGQLYLEGTIDKDFKELAKTAIKRELIPEMLLLWGTPYGIEQLKPKPDDPAIVERKEKLKKMQAVLEQLE